MADILSVNSIATDKHLAEEVGADLLARAMSSVLERNAIRAKSLDDVLLALSGRSPPIFESDITRPEELRPLVVYRSLVRIFRAARKVEGDTFDLRARDYEREYNAAIKRPITVGGGLRGPSGGSFRWERR